MPLNTVFFGPWGCNPCRVRYNTRMKNTTTNRFDFDEIIWKIFGFLFILGGVLLLSIPVGLIIHGLVLLFGGMNVLLGIVVVGSLVPFACLLWEVFDS